MRKQIRTVLALSVVALTIAAFIYYIVKHPETVTQLRHIPPLILVVLLALYAASFLAYVFITRVSLNIFGKTMSRQENILFNAYSSLINFFGPGQSGPAFRAVYLKKRHHLNIKHYALAGLIYYGFFAVLSVGLAFAGSRPWWQTALTAVAAAVVSLLLIRRYQGKLGTAGRLHAQHIAWIGAATALQIVLQVFIFAVELRGVDGHISWGQIMTYTGVANLALFVSFTPGGIGIRESFLLFSQNLHHIDSSTVVAASVVDRATYLVLLGVLFVLVISLHAKDKLRVKQLKTEEEGFHEVKG